MSCKQTTNPKSEILLKNRKLEIGNWKLKPAFTMMELMMAIGIFAVGMSLVAALFPAAIKETENTVKDYEGPTICENGLAIVKAKVTHTALDGCGGNLVPLTIGDTDREFRTYDSDGDAVDDRQRGFIALAKQWAAGRNDYQVVIVAYDVAYNAGTGIANTARHIQLTGTILEANKNTDESILLTAGLTGADYLKIVGSPLIDHNGGRYATILSVVLEGSDYRAYLDHPVYEAVSNPIVIVEEDTSSNILDGSPVIGVLMTRTALRD